MSATAIPAITSTGQPVLILKEGTAQSRGREAQRNNIMAAKLISEVVKSSLGPRGMDKMLVDSLGDVTITNDGATILKEVDVQHPAAKMMVEISKTTDNEVGDGTTSAVVLAGSLLEKAEELIDKDVHPTTIVNGYRKASDQALKVLDRIAIKVKPDDREWLLKVAKTSMVTKLVSKEAGELADLVVNALLQVAEKVGDRYKVDIDDVKVEKKPGVSLKDTKLVKGIVLDKEVVHAGMPKRVEGAKIALINSPLEIEKTEFDAKININNPEQIKMFLDEENRMLKAMVDKIADVGANVVICQKGIDDIAQHFLAKAGMLAVRRVKQSDMDKLAKATSGRMITSLEDLTRKDLGEAELVEERKIETDKWVFIEGCLEKPKAVEEKLYVNSEGAWLEGRVPRVDFHSYITVVHGEGTTAITVPAGYSQLGGSGGWETVEDLDLHAYFPEEVKRLAGVVRDAVKPPEGIIDVILGPQVVGLIAHESAGHPGEADRVLGREAAQAGESYIKPQDLGLKVGCEEAYVSDDPGIPNSSGFYLYDDEGVPARKKRLIESGVVKELLHNRSTAYRFGISSNGSSRASEYDREPIVRMSNTFVEPGDYSFNELVEGIKLGIYIKSFMEWNIDDRRVNQRYVGLEAYRIEGGEVRGAVRSPILEITTNKLWGSLDARGRDLSFMSATCGKGDPQQGIPVWTGGPHIRLRSVRVGSR